MIALFTPCHIFPTAYLAQMRRYASYFRSNNPKQWSTPTQKKQQQQTTGLIQRLRNNIQLLSIGVIVSEKFCFSKCPCFLQVCLAWKTISCQTDKGNRLKHVQFLQGVPVWRMWYHWAISWNWTPGPCDWHAIELSIQLTLLCNRITLKSIIWQIYAIFGIIPGL